MGKQFERFTLKNIQGQKSIMTPLELKEYIDFDVKRIYFIMKPTQPTGTHCHFVEKEMFILIQGKCSAEIDKGTGIEEIRMEGPQNAMYVPNYVWHGFKDFSEDAILLALSSTNYNPDRSDYLEDYDEYLKIRNTYLQK